MIKYIMKSLIYIIIIIIVVVASEIINTTDCTHNECHMSLVETSDVFVVETPYRHENEC